jgi:hypothetical protein
MSFTDKPIRRRQLLLGALTVLLHLLVFRWIGAQVGQPRTEPGQERVRLVIAQLVDARPAPAPAAPPLTPAPAPLPPLPDLDPEPVEPPRRVQPPEAPPAPVPDAAPAQNGPADSVASVPADAAPPAAPAFPVTAAPDVTPAQAVAQAPAPAPPQPEGRRYKVDLPPSADITLAVARIDADGTRWNGEQLLSWTLGPGGYRIRVEAGLRVVFARVNLLTLTSEGKLGDEGFIPTLMTEKRRGRSLTATHFNWDTKKLTFSSSTANYALVPYAQDKASVPLELAAIARADPGQLSGKIEFLVGEDRDASVFSFTVAGQEDIETPLGRIATWHFVRPPKPGSYSSRLELWLAPGYGWYPVQIRNVEASGATTTQTVTNIVIKKEAGS